MFHSEPRDHSIGTILMMSFFLKSHGNNIPLADSNSDITWFIEKRNKMFHSEPRDPSIGTTSDAFFCSISNSDITWFIVENDKLVLCEPRDHSIGTILTMSFCS